MGLPETVRVKLSSEAAGYMALTQVVERDMAPRELVELMLGITGKDVERVRELLRRGTLVSGASRFRWTGWEAAPEDVAALLESFPDPDPSRPFAREQCVRVVLRGPGCRVELSRETGARRRLLRRTSFWDVLMELSAAGPQYLDYSYKERADCYRVEISPAAAAALRRSAGYLRYTSLEAQVRSAAIERVDYYVER